MLIVGYWCMPSPCTAEDFISLSIHSSLLCFLRLTLLFPSFVYSASSTRPCIFLILPFSLFFSSRALRVPPHPRFRWSHRCVCFIDVAVCLRSGVDEQGALGRRVNPLSALVLIGGTRSRVTGPTRKKSDFIIWFYNSNPLPGNCGGTALSKQGFWLGLLYKTLCVVYVLWKPKATLNIMAAGYKLYTSYMMLQLVAWFADMAYNTLWIPA